MILSTAVFLSLATPLAAQSVERTSATSAGVEGNDESYYPAISADGRWVGFESFATNLYAGDSNNEEDVFLWEQASGNLVLVSRHSDGTAGDGESRRADLSGDGSVVVFQSKATNLVANDSNARSDVFMHLPATGQTFCVSTNPGGAPSNRDSTLPRISDSGDFVAFESFSTDLILGDANGKRDIFVRSLGNGALFMASIDSAGGQANDHSKIPTLSADGRYVCYLSSASNLVPGDNNGVDDVFVHDLLTRTTTRVSMAWNGAEANGHCKEPYISADGKVIAFVSAADNLVPGDTNGVDDVFVFDSKDGSISRVSVSSLGGEGNNRSIHGILSADGNLVAFDCLSSNLVLNDLNGTTDNFLHNRTTGETILTGFNIHGQFPAAKSNFPLLTADGMRMVFQSPDGELVSNDTNGVQDSFWMDLGPVNPVNSIILTAPFLAPTGQGMELKWSNAPTNSPYVLAWSLNLNGLVFGGAQFDIGAPYTSLISGLTSATGAGSFTTTPIPSAAAGLTVYFEMGAKDAAARIHDSITQAVVFH